MPAHQDPAGTFWGTPVLLDHLLYLTFVSDPCWYHTLRCEPRPVSHAFGRWPQRLTQGTGYKHI